MEKSYTIINLRTGEEREVVATAPMDSIDAGIDTQNLRACRVVIGANGVRIERPMPILPQGERLGPDEVIFDGENEAIDWVRGEVIEMLVPPSSYAYREFLEAKATLFEQVSALTERVAALEARGMGELVVEGGEAVDKAPVGEPVDNREEGSGAGDWEVEGAEAGASVSVSEADGGSRGEEKEGAAR